jgi:hypothetical protein
MHVRIMCVYVYVCICVCEYVCVAGVWRVKKFEKKTRETVSQHSKKRHSPYTQTTHSNLQMQCNPNTHKKERKNETLIKPWEIYCWYAPMGGQEFQKPSISHVALAITQTIRCMYLRICKYPPTTTTKPITSLAHSHPHPITDAHTKQNKTKQTQQPLQCKNTYCCLPPLSPLPTIPVYMSPTPCTSHSNICLPEAS